MTEWTEKDQQLLDSLVKKQKLYEDEREKMRAVNELREMADRIERDNFTLKSFDSQPLYSNKQLHSQDNLSYDESIGAEITIRVLW